MKFDIAIDEGKDPYKGMRRSERKRAMKKDKDYKIHKEREKKAFDYANSLLGKK